jgi:chromosome segregation ATPase
LSSLDDLQKQRESLQAKIKQTEDMIGKGLDWKDAQFYIEKYNEEMRLLDVKIAKSQLGEDAVVELRTKKQQLQSKLKSLDDMKKSGDVSDKVYKEKKKDIEKEIQQVERDIVEQM